jgi:hypothetical protein
MPKRTRHSGEAEKKEPEKYRKGKVRKKKKIARVLL